MRPVHPKAPRAPARGFLLAAGIIAVVLAPARAPAQVFRVQAGSSSLHQANGGAISVWDGNYEGSISVGDLNPVRVGASVRTRVRGTDLCLGDQVVPFRLPTDVFGTGQSFLGRGVGALYAEDDVSLFALGGTTATGFATPYGFGARPDDPVGLVFLEGRVSPSVRMSSRSLYCGGMTTIAGMEWTPGRQFGAALAGGAGAEEGYLAGSTHWERGPLGIQAAYVLAGDGFRRVVVPQPQASELDRENIQVTARPRPDLALVAARNNYIQPPARAVPGPTARGSVNQLTATGRAAGTTASAALFLSEAPGGGGAGVSFSLGRGVGSLLKLQGSVMHSNPRHGDPTTVFVGSVREIVSPRIELLQVATHSQGNTTVSFGGDILLDRASVGVEYQTVYVPFASQDPFRQALMVHASIRAIGDFQANLGSYVGPDGEVRYTVYGSQYFYRGKQSAVRQTFQIDPNVVRGRVQTESGTPIPGAAVQVGDETAYTNSQGAFFVRTKKARTYPFKVLLDEFLNPGLFEVVDAPTDVEAKPEAQAPEIVIVLRRAAGR